MVVRNAVGLRFLFVRSPARNMKMISAHVKEIHGFQYFTGNHPEIRSQNRSKRRPVEFGNKVWASSLRLIGHLQKAPFELRERRVLEIGCGWGLLGVYLAKVFDCEVTCSDFDDNVLPIVELHAQLNKVTVQTQKASFLDLSQESLDGYDIILGAEVCYSEAAAVELMGLIEKAVHDRVKDILIVDPGRPDFEDCCQWAQGQFHAKVHELPGTANGKVTKLLHIRGGAL